METRPSNVTCRSRRASHETACRSSIPSVTSSLIGADREFPSRGPRDLEGIAVEVAESGENAAPDLPTCGYLVTDRETSVSIFHTGDLHEPYPELEASQRARVDYLVHMKTGLTEWEGEDQTDRLQKLVDWVRPRFLIPTHYRTDRRSDPIPHGTWPPDVTDANAFVEWIRDQVGDRTTILPFTAGVWYEVALPSLEVVWKWNWRRTWDVPPWRHRGYGRSDYGRSDDARNDAGAALR